MRLRQARDRSVVRGTRARTEGVPPPDGHRGQPRPDPRPGRAGEQPQEHRRRHPEATSDGVHGRVRVGQELARLRHDRRRIPPDDRRDVSRLRPGLHAVALAARRGRARGPDHRDHRGPGAHGGERPLHRWHRDRRERAAADPLQPPRPAARRLAERVFVQHPHRPRDRHDHDRARRPDHGRPVGEARLDRLALRRRGDRRAGLGPDRAAFLHGHGRDVPALRGPGHGLRHRPRPALRRIQVHRRRRDHDPGLQGRQLVDGRHLRGIRVPRPHEAHPRLHRPGAP